MGKSSGIFRQFPTGELRCPPYTKSNMEEDNASTQHGVSKVSLNPSDGRMKADTDLGVSNPCDRGISIRYIHRVFGSKTNHQVSLDTIKSIKKEIERYVDDIVASIVTGHNQQNEIRRKVGLDIRKTIHGVNLYLNNSAEPIYNVKLVSKQGEVGQDNRDTTLSTEVM